jgi:hypothetical protein
MGKTERFLPGIHAKIQFLHSGNRSETGRRKTFRSTESAEVCQTFSSDSPVRTFEKGKNFVLQTHHWTVNKVS